ncbi:MAG: GlcG/HbpS family heme-binding protein [Pseudonocardiaceae bacterium]
MPTIRESSPRKSYATASITRQAAADLLDAARAVGQKLGFEPATAIVDIGGHLVAFERGDTTPFLAGTIAIDKAWTAASYRVSSSYWNDYVQNPAVSALQNSPRVMPVGGGYAIVDDDHVVGAIGISGGTLAQDERAALAAIEQLGFTTTDASRSSQDD